MPDRPFSPIQEVNWMAITLSWLPAHSSGCLVNDLRYLISQQPLMFLHGIPLSFSFKFSNFSQKKSPPLWGELG